MWRWLVRRYKSEDWTIWNLPGQLRRTHLITKTSRHKSYIYTRSYSILAPVTDTKEPLFLIIIAITLFHHINFQNCSKKKKSNISSSIIRQSNRHKNQNTGKGECGTTIVFENKTKKKECLLFKGSRITHHRKTTHFFFTFFLYCFVCSALIYGPPQIHVNHLFFLQI